MTNVIKYLNEKLDTKEVGNDETICNWLTRYCHTSLTYYKQNIDGSWLITQPAWPERTVVKYYIYNDYAMARAHKTTRLVMIFDDNTEYEISLYKFKRYLRHMYSLTVF